MIEALGMNREDGQDEVPAEGRERGLMEVCLEESMGVKIEMGSAVDGVEGVID